MKFNNNLIGYRIGESARVILRTHWSSISKEHRKSLITSLERLGANESDEGETCLGDPKPITPCEEGYEWSCGIYGWFQAEIF